MTINVYLSMGRPFTAAQEKFSSGIENYLNQRGLCPQTLAKQQYQSNEQPLRLINELMDQCNGAIVIALERVSIESGVERRGAPNQTRISDAAIPSPWIQIEAALAYAKRLPILVVKENRVRSEGLLEEGYDWYVHSTELNLSFLDSTEFGAKFESWQRDVLQRAR